MRIRSQDGIRDINYDAVALKVAKDNSDSYNIWAYSLYNNDDYVLGTYESQAEANMAMNMVRDRCLKHWQYMEMPQSREGRYK